jgi:chorismate mutase
VSSTNGHRPIVCRGVRGAISVEENTAQAILDATREMLEAIIDANGMDQEDIASVIFSTTVDLNAEYPALAARQLGWHDVALFCGHEMNVPHGLKMVVRVLIHWNTTLKNNEIQHIYLKDAANLRPDRSIELKSKQEELR